MSGEELLNEIGSNPSCVDDPGTWNFTKLKIAFEAVPENFKKENPCVKMMPKVLRQWFNEHAPKLAGLGFGGGGGGGGGGGAPPQQQQQQQMPPQQQMQQQQQFDPMQQQQQMQQQMPPQQQFDPNVGMQQQQMMDPNMGMQQQQPMMGGMDMGMGFDQSMNMGMQQDPNALMTMPFAKYNQIKERFNERDLELKQAHLQIQLMQLQIEKLEAENKMLKENQWSGGGRQRANTENLFDM